MNKIITSFVLLSLFCLAIIFPSNAQVSKTPAKIDTTKNKDNYLEMRGTITKFVGAADINSDLPPLESVLVTVFCAGQKLNEYGTNTKGRVTFRLNLDKQYKIQVSKTGYVTKFFDVNAKVNNTRKGAFTFNFTVDVFEETNKLDVSVLKKPIAKVTYDPIYDRFQYDDSYTSRINFDLKKMYKNYYVLQEAAADSLKKLNKANGVTEPVEKAPVQKPNDKRAKTPPPKKK